LHQPISQTEANDSGFNVSKVVVTNCSPTSIVVDFHTSLALKRTSCQSDVCAFNTQFQLSSNVNLCTMAVSGWRCKQHRFLSFPCPQNLWLYCRNMDVWCHKQALPLL